MAYDISMRPDPHVPEDASLVIHMGDGEKGIVTKNIITNYSRYKGVSPTHPNGAFVVSVYVATDGVSVQDIVDSLEHARVGRAPYALVRASYTLWPTLIKGTAIPDNVMRVHFDVVLDVDSPVPDPAELDRPERKALSRELEPHVEALMRLFDPRTPREDAR